MACTRMLLVRHGDTTTTEAGRFAGATDVDLSEAGRAQARRLAERLAGERLAAVYTSPLVRCVDTARTLAKPHGLEPVARDALREIDHGRWEGLRKDEVKARFPEEYAAWVEDPFGFAPQGGTTGAEVIARALPALREIAQAHAGENVLVVTHKGVVRLALSILLGADPRRYRDRIDQLPCALNVIDFDGPRAPCSGSRMTSPTTLARVPPRRLRGALVRGLPRRAAVKPGPGIGRTLRRRNADRRQRGAGAAPGAASSTAVPPGARARERAASSSFALSGRTS